jgi:putative transposase
MDTTFHLEVFMEDEIRRIRVLAVERFKAGESPNAICISLGKTKYWLYKWVKRYDENDTSWCEDRSRRPQVTPRRTSSGIEEIVKQVRQTLYSHDQFCGAQAILWELEDRQITPLPSVRTINRILVRNDLVQRRTGAYIPKGTPYPQLASLRPNQAHQADLVGPCYLEGPIRFYGLNVIDVNTARCGLYPSGSKAGQDLLDGFWEIWKRLGVPEHLQVDNTLSFFGSPKHPHGMGPLIRLCLHMNIELWFIPMAEPWRNGVIEQFNNFYQQKFLARVHMTTRDVLKQETLMFEHRHNSRYRYSKLHGDTPLKALVKSSAQLRFPETTIIPNHFKKNPENGCYHLVRLIRSDLKLNIFGELFSVAPELSHEYVVATINVKDQKLMLFCNKKQVDEFAYKLR